MRARSKNTGKVTNYGAIAAKELVGAKAIYRIEAKDAKTTAAKRLLKDVDVRGREVHVTLGL